MKAKLRPLILMSFLKRNGRFKHTDTLAHRADKNNKPSVFDVQSLHVFLQFIFDAIDKSLPACLDYVLRYTYRAPD